MKTLTKMAIIVIFGAVLLQAATLQQTINSHGVHATMSSNQALSTGTNTIFLKFDGAKYKGASVRVKAVMPAMPGMPAMHMLAHAVSIADGKYKVRLNLPMSGTWQLFIYITTKSGKHDRIKSFLNF